MALNVGELFGTLTIKGTAQAVKSLDDVQAAFTETGAAAGKAGALVDESSAALVGSGKAASLASAGSAKFRQAQLQLFAATEKYTALLEDENASLAQLARAEATVIGAQERLNKAMASSAAPIKGAGTAAAETEGRFAAMRASMASTVEMAGKLGLALGAFEAIKKAIDITKQASEYQRSMTQIKTLTGASQAEVDALSKTLLGMAGKVAASPEDLATSAYHAESALRKLGATAPDIYKTVQVAAEGAKIGNTDLEDTTNALTATMASGIESYKNAGKAMGALLSIVGTGDMKVSDLNDALGSGLLVTMRTFGVSLTDTGAALAVFGDNNIRGANAATKLRMSVQDIAKPAVGADAVLSRITLTSQQLQTALTKNGLNAALQLLNAHMKAAGVTGSQVGAFLEDAFTKKAGAGLAILLTRLDQFDAARNQVEAGADSFGQRWSDTTKTAAFQFDRLGASAQAAGIKMAGAVLPAAGALAGGLMTGLTGALHVLSALLPVIKVVGAAWAGMFAVKLGRAGIQAAVDGAQLLSAAMKNAASDTAVSMGLMARDSGATAAVMQADLAQMGAAAAAEGAEIDQAAANAAAAQATVAAAIGAASDEEIAAYQAAATAAQAQADASVAAAAQVAAAADAAAAEVDAAGETASIGWSGLALGPLAAATAGILAIVTLFHKSSSASKEATDAAKAYSDALSGGDADQSTIVDTIVSQLAKNNVPQTLDQLNASLGRSAVTGKQFITAIETGGKPLDDMRARLQSIIDAGTHLQERGRGAFEEMTPAAKAAAAALKDLNAQYDGLSTTVRNDLKTQAFAAGVSSSIDQVGQSMGYTAKTAETYAAMLGIIGDKNHVVDQSSTVVKAAIMTVAQAYKSATATGQEFLSALNTFSQSAGTAADRAQLIGATLKAANGDALNFAAQMNAAAGAATQLGTDIASAAKAIGKNGETTKAYLDSIVNLKNGTIDYRKAAAAPLINDMQAMQTAAMNTAQAVYEHARATKTGAQAADEAYKAYKNQTSGALIDEAQKLGLTAGQAKKLADQYFGMPKHVKTLIEQEGADPVVTVLNKIGRLLADLVGKPWNLNVKSNASHVIEQINGIKYAIDNIPSSKNVYIRTVGGGDTASARANGGGLPEGVSAVGERGPELAIKQGSHVEILSNAQSRSFLRSTGMKAPGFAEGTIPNTLAGNGTGLPTSSGHTSAGLGKGNPLDPFGWGSVYHAGTGTASSVLFGAAGLIGQALIKGVQMAGDKVMVVTRGIAASMQSVLKAATNSVIGKVAASVAPAVTDPTQLAAIFGRGESSAISKTQSASIAGANYKKLQANADDLSKSLTKLKASDAAAEQAARNHAKALSTQAANIHDTSKAAEAEKKSLEDQARAASNAATKLQQANQKHEDALGKVVTAANNTAAKAKTAYGKIKTAADNATQAAEQDAQNLISSIDSQFQTLQQNIADYESTISDGLMQGSDLATVWGALGDAVSTASDNLSTAQSNLQDAQDAVAQATPDTTAYTQALQAQADALAQVNAAHAALVQAQQTGNQAGILAAQQAQTAATQAYTTAIANAADAQANLTTAAAPTADQLQAVTDAQTALTQAQNDYNTAVAANTESGLQAKFNQLLANTQKFAADLTVLQKQAGNSQAAQSFISQLAGMGVDAGDALAQQLLAAGPSGVTALMSTMGQIQDVADQEGATLAQGFYGQGVSALQQLVKGLEDEFPNLVQALAPYLAQLTSMFTITPTITTPVTGTLTGAGTTPAAKTFTTTLTHPLSVVAAKHATTVEKLILANPSLNGDSAASVIKAGTKLNIPAFANGVKNFAGGLALVGERGPELVTLPAGASVIPNDAQGGAGTVSLHPDDRALLQQVAERPVELWVNDRGKTKIGEIANDHRQLKRLAGKGTFR